jgi:hypothetical protein
MFGAQEILPGVVLPQETTELPFAYKIDANPNELFTVMVYDLNAVDPSYMHYMYVNVKNSDPATGNEIYSYEPAHPPPGTGRHEYVIAAGKQREFIQPSVAPADRGGYEIDAVIDRMDFERIAKISFFVDAPNA